MVIREALLSLAAIGTVGVSILCMAAGPSDGVNVTVVNPSANPVPVTGSVTVSGAVTGSVTGTVGLAPGTSVLIGNSQTNPAWVLDVSKSTSNMVEIGCRATRVLERSPSCILVNSEASNVGTFVVPQGQRLVITNVDIATEGALTGVTEVVLFQGPVSGAFLAVRERWIVPNATPTVQLHFEPGIVVAPGYVLAHEIDQGNTTGLVIRGYLTAL